MAWALVKTERLPLGTRVLDYGMEGTDVKELQALLKKTGFYAAQTDGAYGPLTREAVLLFQKTFALKTDGIAGRQVIAELKNVSQTAASGGGEGSGGRIIYTVKAGDSLENVSRKFGANSVAWRGLLHKGTTLKKIYPGMKLLLHKKAVFSWNTAPDSHQKTDLNRSLTGQIKIGWRFDTEGNVSRESTDTPAKNFFYLLQADSPAWENVLIRRKLRRKLAGQLQSLNQFSYGFDLRQASLSALPYYASFIKLMVRQNPRRQKMKFLLLPLLSAGSRTRPAGIVRSYWENLPLLCQYTQFLMLEPELDFETPLTFMNSARQFKSNLRRLIQLGISHQCAILCEAGAWDWDLEDNTYQPISLKKAKIIRGMFPRETEYSSDIQSTTIYYTHRSRRHCLIFRDEQGWDEFFKLLNCYNFFGTVIREFDRLGENGLKLIANSFAILTEE